MSDFFDLPEMVLDLVNARDRLAAHYRDSGRTFTFDGKLVGDLGEAIAAELFGLTLAPQQAFDGRAPDGRTVQVKASTTGAGPAFRKMETGADHLLHSCSTFRSGAAKSPSTAPNTSRSPACRHPGPKASASSPSASSAPLMLACLQRRGWD